MFDSIFKNTIHAKYNYYKHIHVLLYSTAKINNEPYLK